MPPPSNLFFREENAMANREDKLPEQDVALQKGRFLLWLENYWYHYKWHTIVSLFFAFTLLFCLVQCVKREEPDLLLVAAGDIAFTDTDARDAFVSAFGAVAPGQGKGEKQKVEVSHYTIFSPEQMTSLSTDESGEYSPATFTALKLSSQTEYDAFTSFRMTGESCLYLVSDYIYENSNLKEYAVPLSELFEKMPESALDDYSVRFSELAFSNYYAACGALPDDFRLVLTKPLVVGKASKEAVYNAYTALFCAIVSFEEP